MVSSISKVPKPPPTLVSVSYNNLTPAEKLKAQAAVNAAMKSINYSIKAQAGVVSLAQGSMGGISSHGPGHVGVSMGPETKQPQDKVLRLVTSRYKAQASFTYCVIWCAYMVLFSIFAGLNLGEGFSWWKTPLTLLPPALGATFMCVYVKSFFKEAEAKADLLDWPKQ